MKRIKAILIIGMAVLLMAATACSKPAAKTEGEAVPTPEQNQTVEAYGIIKVNDTKNINLDFAANVGKIPVKEGQKVKKGDVLVVLDMQQYNLQLKQKQDELAIIKVEIKKLEGKLTEAEVQKGIDPESQKLISDLKYAREDYDKAVADLTGQTTLFESGAISQNDYDSFKKNVDSKKQNLDNARLAIDGNAHNRQRGNNEISDNIRIQYLKAAELESGIASLKSKVEKTYIKDGEVVADMENGIVYEISYIEGDIVDASKKLLSLMNLDTMVVEANVSEEFIKDVKSGAKAEIMPAADKSKKYHGKVISIAGKAQLQNGETVVPVQISIDDKDDFLLPNFNVDIAIYK